jgi:hypothetical protein
MAVRLISSPVPSTHAFSNAGPGADVGADVESCGFLGRDPGVDVATFDDLGGDESERERDTDEDSRWKIFFHSLGGCTTGSGLLH